MISVLRKTPRPGAAHPDHSAPGLGLRLGSMTPNVRLSLNHYTTCNVATLIERFFTERLMRQRNVSANTIASYKDTFRLLFMFAQERLGDPHRP
jgi:hypothetical protein